MAQKEQIEVTDYSKMFASRVETTLGITLGVCHTCHRPVRFDLEHPNSRLSNLLQATVYVALCRNKHTNLHIV